MKLLVALECAITLLVELSTSGSCRSLPVSFDAADYAPVDVITRDVFIAGGGASGTYAAVRLQQDFNKSVVVVEQKPVLGGHTQTYIDTASNSTIELGVIAYHDLPVVHAFFSRFAIPLATLSFSTVHLNYVDFRTGQSVNITTRPNDTLAAFMRWANLLAQNSYLSQGFVLPNPVPPDLTLTLGQLIEKYNLSAIVSYFWSFGQGHGDILNAPALYALKFFGPQVLRGASTAFLTTARRNNHELYEKALDVLGNGTNVFLNSSVYVMARDLQGEYGSVVISTPSGNKLIQAKQFLFTIPPTIENLAVFDLDKAEADLFSQFQISQYYTGLLSNVSVARNTTIENRVASADNYHLPRLPTSYTLGTTFTPSRLADVKFGSNVSLSLQDVQSKILAEANRVVPGPTPQIVTLLDHSPFGLQVSAQAIRDGFYSRLYQLQGRRRTFWTGAAWHVHDSSLLWNFTDAVLAQMQHA